jgi:hypothetical protein
MFLKDAYCFCNLAKFFKESDRAPCPIVSLPGIYLLKHILPLIQRHRTLLLIFIVKSSQLLVIYCAISVNELALRIAMGSQTTIGACIWVFSVNQFLYTSHTHFRHQWKIPSKRLTKCVRYRYVHFSTFFAIVHGQHPTHLHKMSKSGGWRACYVLIAIDRCCHSIEIIEA